MSNNLIVEGLLTNIWGPSTWETLHCISFGYPKNPTEEDKNDYFIFFKMISKVLPCCVCRDHYSTHISSGKNELNYDVMKCRESLTRWLYNLHMDVNKQQGVLYNISYADLCDKYTSFIAECQMTPEMKMKPYSNYYNREAPLIELKYAKCFIDYAKLRNVVNFEEKMTEFNSFNQKSDDWIERNIKCWEIIKYMRINAIDAVERHGEYKGYPTIKELELISMMCTTMSQKLIKHIVKKMGYIFTNKYQLVK